MYNQRVWLNPETSSYSGSIICFHGYVEQRNNETHEEFFIEISDCFTKIRLHSKNAETFIKKIEKLQDSINSYLIYLKNQKETI